MSFSDRKGRWVTRVTNHASGRHPGRCERGICGGTLVPVLRGVSQGRESRRAPCILRTSRTPHRHPLVRSGRTVDGPRFHATVDSCFPNSRGLLCCWRPTWVLKSHANPLHCDAVRDLVSQIPPRATFPLDGEKRTLVQPLPSLGKALCLRRMIGGRRHFLLVIPWLLVEEAPSLGCRCSMSGIIHGRNPSLCKAAVLQREPEACVAKRSSKREM